MAGFFNTSLAELPEVSALSDRPTSLAAAVLTDDNRVIVIVVAAVAVAALIVARLLVRQVLAAGEGTERMKEIAAAVQEGANAYLARQLRTVGIFAVVVFFLLLLLPADNWSQQAAVRCSSWWVRFSRRPPDTSVCVLPYAAMCEWLPRPVRRRRLKVNRKKISPPCRTAR